MAPTVDYPASHRDLLDAPGVAVMTTVTPSGALQSTPVWYLLDDGKLKVSSTGARRKVRNLQADPRVTMLFIDPTNAFRWLEVRGTASTELDRDLVVQRKLGVQYANDTVGADRPGTVRYVITINPETVNISG
jgi:PPOX class probable F420-dependent enzyme